MSALTPTTVTVVDVERIGELARLRPEGEELLGAVEDMNRILGMVDQLRALDTTGVEPLHHVLDLQNVLREDVVHPSFDAETALKNAPARKGDYFLVPKVIKGAEG